VDASLEQWYSGVKSAYDALRKANSEHMEANGPVARRLLGMQQAAAPSVAEGDVGVTRVGKGGMSERDKWDKIDALMRQVELLVGGSQGGVGGGGGAEGERDLKR